MLRKGFRVPHHKTEAACRSDVAANSFAGRRKVAAQVHLVHTLNFHCGEWFASVDISDEDEANSAALAASGINTTGSTCPESNVH